MNENVCSECKGEGGHVRRSADLHPMFNIYGWDSVVHRGEVYYSRKCKACAGTGFRPTGTSGVPIVARASS